MNAAIRCLTVILSLIIYPAFALECYSESPTLVKGLNLFEHQKPTELTRHEQKNFKKLLEKLDGEWEGLEVSFECIGNENNVRKRRSEKSLTMEIEHASDNSARLASRIYSEEKRSTRYEYFRLFLADDSVRLDSRRPEGDIELLSLRRDGVSFLSRYFIRNQKVIALEDIEHPELGVLPAIRDAIVSILPSDDSDEVSIQPIDPDNHGDVSIQPIDDSGDVRIQPVIPEERSRDKKREVEYLAGGALREVIRTVSLKGNQLSIQITAYTNGYLSSSYLWTVRR